MQQLICLHSNEAAFATLFRLCYASLYHFAMQYVHRHEVAEEVVNDVFVNIWKQRTTLHSVQNLESYLFIAVKNGSLNYLKKYSHLHIAMDEEKIGKLISLHNPEQEMEWKELYFKLQQAIQALPDQCRTVFRLVKEEGFRMKEVADILGISPRTVETQLYRAVKKLDVLLNEYYHHQKKNTNASGMLLLLFSLLMMTGG